MKKNIATEISWADSTFESFSMDDSESLHVYVTLWTAEKVCITFHNCISIKYLSLGDLSDIVELELSHPVAQEALAWIFSQIPEQHGFKLFGLENVDGTPAFLAVAQGFSINRE